MKATLTPSANADLIAEWHPTKNLPLTPETVSLGSGHLIWWIGKTCGHEWSASIRDRVRGRGCRYCSGKYTLAGVNDLGTLEPDIAAEWHPTKNGNLTPQQVRPSSNKSVWWQCTAGKHEWAATIAQRTRPTGCPFCSGRKAIAGQTDLATLNPALAAEWHPTKNGTLKPQDVTLSSSHKVWWQCTAGKHEWAAHVYSRSSGYGCPECSAQQRISKPELMIREHLLRLLPDLNVLVSDRKALEGKELDLYLPDFKLGIEFNGIYWHSEAMGKTKTYHAEKRAAAVAHNIRLLQIWEDDWERNPDLILKMIEHKLGISNSDRIHARKTDIEVLDYTQAAVFLNRYHIQGAVAGTYYWGLKHAGALVAVIVFTSQGKHELLLSRYATSAVIPGGFTKLLAHAVKTLNPRKIYTFSDASISDGQLYEKTGFVRAAELPPDYAYVVNRVRVHKFNYRLKRFREDSELIYVQGLSENELAKLNGLTRIWDAGKTRWEKTYIADAE